MSGFIKLHRGWQSSDMFDGAGPYCERAAWVWILSNTAWKETTRRNGKGETISINRGQIHVSLSALASSWGWSIKRVRTFLKMLENGHAIGTTKGTTGTIITVSNYEKYQEKPEYKGTNEGTVGGTTGAQPGHTQEEEKEIKEEKNTHYAFFGRVVKLNSADLGRWRARYHAIGDIEAQLGALDDWLSTQSEAEQGKWFHIASSALNKKHQEILNKETNEQSWEMPIA